MAESFNFKIWRNEKSPRDDDVVINKIHAEMKHSDWLQEATWPGTSNQRALFQPSMLKFVYDIGSKILCCTHSIDVSYCRKQIV